MGRVRTKRKTMLMRWLAASRWRHLRIGVRPMFPDHVSHAFVPLLAHLKRQVLAATESEPIAVGSGAATSARTTGRLKAARGSQGSGQTADRPGLVRTLIGDYRHDSGGVRCIVCFAVSGEYVFPVLLEWEHGSRKEQCRRGNLAAQIEYGPISSGTEYQTSNRISGAIPDIYLLSRGRCGFLPTEVCFRQF